MSHQRTVSGQRLRVLLLVVGSLVAAGGVLTVLGLAIWVLPPTLVGAQLPTNATITDADRLFLAIPQKRFERALVAFLDRAEIIALLSAPDRSTWFGRRDHALLLVAIQTGLRLAELTSLVLWDVHLGAGPHLRCLGKGRKERCTPLTFQTVAVLRTWLRERGGAAADPLFPTVTGMALSPDAVQRLVGRYAATAAQNCPSLRGKRVTPHVLRHTSAMQLLKSGNDITVVALWLGHEQVTTTQIYLHADMSLKERALARSAPANVRAGRFQAPDALLAFLGGR